MAQNLQIAGVSVRRRHPWGAWALAIVTLGIYGVVYQYKINRELRDVSDALHDPFDNNPVVSALAYFPGSILWIPPFWSMATTADRVRKLERRIIGDFRVGVSPVLAVVLGLLLEFRIVYMQTALNEIWEAAAATEARGPAGMVSPSLASP
jgi:hypothetical protein